MGRRNGERERGRWGEEEIVRNGLCVTLWNSVNSVLKKI